MDIFNIKTIDGLKILEHIEVEPDYPEGSLNGFLVSKISDKFKNQDLLIDLESSEKERIFESFTLLYINPENDTI